MAHRMEGASMLARLGVVAFGLVALAAGCDERDDGRDAVAPVPTEAVAVETERGAAPVVPEGAAPDPEAGTEPAPVPLPEGVPAGAQAAVVEHITDGDTIHVRVDEPGGPLTAGASHTVRLLEMDTPETKHPDRGVECWGPEASAFTARELVVGSTVHLVADEEGTDRYGRFLRYVWTDDGVFFNERAVREGHARAVLYEPNDAHIDALRTAEADARAARRGLWGASCSDGAAADVAAPEQPGDGCAPSYVPCVPPAPPDLDCADLSGPVQVTGVDPHRLDGDADGWGCEG